jgi:hypothetical protein
MHYVIHYNDYKFIGVVESADDDDKSFYVTVGGHGTKCCMLLVTRKTIVLQDLFYHHACAALKDLARGYGTVTLLQAAIKFATTLFPKPKVLELQDESSFECEAASKKLGIVSLSDHNFLIYGETWYQRHIPGLQIVNTESRSRELTDVARTLDSVTWKSSQPYKLFWKTVCENNFMSKDARVWFSKKNKPLYDLIRSLYTEATTLRQFLLTMHQTTAITRADICRFELETFPYIKQLIGMDVSLQGSLCRIRVKDMAKYGGDVKVYETKAFEGIRFEKLRRVFPSARLEGGGLNPRWKHRYGVVG